MEIFAELSIAVFAAVFFGAIMKLLRQPLMVGYIIAGIVTGPYMLNLMHSTSEIELFSNIGIAILLFIVGMNLNPEIIRDVGETSVFVAVVQVVLTTTVGFVCMKELGFDTVSAAYGGAALAFSSTIIVLKIFSDKEALHKLYGKIVIGLLLVEDIIASFLLVAASIGSKITEGAATGTVFAVLGMKLIISLALIYLIAKYILPKLSAFFASTHELLFLFSIAWGLMLASSFYVMGFSIGIGALVAGASFALSPFAEEIASRLKPLRDFFLMLFFVLLGTKIALTADAAVIYPAVILSLVVLILNPIIVFIIMNLLGYKNRNSFMVAITSSQISEFSLILLSIGFSSGQVSSTIVSIVTLVFVFTISVSTYLILYSETIYEKTKHIIAVFEFRKSKKHGVREKYQSHEMLIFGFDRVGEDYAEAAKHIGANFAAVDYNPRAIERLITEGIPFKYGDADDVEFLHELDLQNTKLLVSTVPDFKTNVLIAKTYREFNPSGIAIFLAHDVGFAKKLYEHGATYVVMPHYLGAHHASKMIEKYGFDVEGFDKERNIHLHRLEKRSH